MTEYIVFPILGYLLGSIPSGLLYGKWVKGIDIRKVGSGNVGATNAARALGKVAFVIVLLADIAKGVLAVWIARWLKQPENIQVFAGMAAILGHTYTIFLRFRGGKGVATSLGVFVTLSPYPTISALVVFLIVLGLGRYVSLASISGSVALFASGFVGLLTRCLGPWTFGAIAISTALVVLRHRANIERLRAGTEPKIGQRSKKISEG